MSKDKYGVKVGEGDTVACLVSTGASKYRRLEHGTILTIKKSKAIVYVPNEGD